MADGGLRFGLFLGQVGHDWPAIRERFQVAERLGFDYAWLVDHFLATDGPRDQPCMEAWTLLAALATQTSRIRLGVLVSANTFRHPSLLMKEAVTVDRISGGRLVLGIGTAWFEEEHRRFGFPFPPAGERVARLEEALEMAHLLMREARSTFRGRYYQLDDVPFEPKPAQRPRIPILIGAHRPRMLRLAARHADMWDTYPTHRNSSTEGVRDEIQERVARLEQYCREIGRDPGEIRRSTWTGAEAFASEDTFERFVGAFRPLGFTDFTASMPGAGPTAALERIATQLIPALRSG